MSVEHRPNPELASLLGARDYRVLPVVSHAKHSSAKGWQKMTPEECREEVRRYAAEATGWVVNLHPQDEIPMTVLDIDTKGLTEKEIAGLIFPMEGEIPPNAGLVKTPSGGWHIWFQTRPGSPKLESEFNFESSAVKGDVRQSSSGRQGLMLGGSVARNKDGDLMPYEIVQPIVPDELPFMSEQLIQRLSRAAEEQALDTVPTEVLRLMEDYDLIPDDAIKNGVWCNRAYALGLLIGRLLKSSTLNKDTYQRVLAQYMRICENGVHKVNPDTFKSNFDSGLEQGAENAAKYDKVPKNPPASATMAEAEALFGARPWLQANQNDDGKTEAHIIGLGTGSGEVVTSLDPIIVLTELTRMARVDADAVTRSPLYLQPTWWKAFKLAMSIEATRISTAASPEETLETALARRVRECAAAGRYGTTVEGGYSEGADDWIMHKGGKLSLMITRQGLHRLVTSLPPKVKALLNGYGDERRGRRVRTVWQFPLEHIDRDGSLKLADYVVTTVASR